MKFHGLVFLCAAALVQGRSSGFRSDGGALAELGDNPHVVHLRTAISTSGLLTSATGSLISSTWVLTSAATVQSSRFIWIRYGVVDVIRPELVTETSVVRIHPQHSITTGDHDIALISINRVVQNTPNIRPIGLTSDPQPPLAGILCGFGGGDSIPGERLRCIRVNLDGSESSESSESDESDESALAVGYSLEGQATRFDIGGPLVNNNVQVGILISTPLPNGDSVGVFLGVNRYLGWIQSVTGLSLSDGVLQAEVAPEVTPEFAPEVAPEIDPESVLVVDN